MNGVRQADAWGVATNKVTFTMGNEPIEAVAHCVADEQSRQAHYWYGGDVGPDSDTDGDGYTLAEELKYGMNPVFPNVLQLGGVAYGDSNVVLYNPNEYPEVTIRSEPEGVFATESLVLRPGQEQTTGTYTPDDRFAQWTRNGERQADAWGRALEAVTIVGNPGVGKVELVADFVDDEHTRLSRYWYGVDNQPKDSDTDGDGYTFSEEIQYGLNPLFPNVLQLGGVAYGDSPVQEVNLQPFDMGSQALVENVLEELFATLDGATGELVGGMDFSGPVSVAVVDVDADDNFDFLVYDGTLRLFHNIGTPGSPEWEITEATQVEITAVGKPQILQIKADLGSATADRTASMNATQTLAKTTEESVAKDSSVTSSVQVSVHLCDLENALAGLARPVMVGGETEKGPAVWFCDDGGVVSRCDLATGEIVETGLTGFPVWDETTGFGVFANNTLTLVDQTLTLDAAVEAPCAAALSDATGDGAADLLVADTQGRISLYARTADGFALEHRVWGGSFIGFAEGLTLAPVDWESDGDLDMLCGTATGKLLLLSDPNVGRPSNLRATAGYDNVLLTWDPNGQSRIYGYGVYRAQGADFARIAEASLPTHRDTPPSLATWSYRVTALSRLWTAGNSEPETFESLPSEVVSVDLGGVTLSMPEVLTSYDDAEIALPIVVDNTKGLGAFTLTVTYDPAIVEPLGYEPTALTEGLAVTSTPVNGTWTLSATGALTAGSGPLFRLRFHVKAGAFGETAFRLTEADFTAIDGKSVATNALPIETTLTVQARPLPATVTLRIEDAQAKTGETIRVPVTVEAVDPIDWATLSLTSAFDAGKLRLVSRTEATEGEPTLTLTFEVLEQHGDDLFATVTVDGTATGANGLPATVVPATATISITDSNPPVPAVVTLTATDVEAETLSQVTVEVSVTPDSPIDWESLTLTPEFDAGKLSLVAQTPATEGRPATFIFEVLEQHGDNLFATVTVSGTATGANGLPATVLPATATISIADSNPPVPAVVTLTATDVEAETLSQVTVEVSVTSDSPIDWESLTLTPEFDAGKLSLVAQTPATEGRPATFTFEVLEQHGDNLFATVTVSGKATGANGLPATVLPATATITITDSNPPVPAVVTLTATDTEAETLSQVTVEVSVTSDSSIDWKTLTLTPDFDAGKLTLVTQTPATEGRPATFIFEVLEQHGDNLFATVTVSGTATGANGLPATVLPATATISIADSNPPVPAVVTLTATDVEAATLSQVTVEVSVTPDSPIDWESLTLTPAFDANKLSLVSQTPATEGRPATFTFEVLEQHGDNLFATVTISGTATGANGLPATVLPATATISIADSNPPVPAVVTLTTTDVPANVGETITVSVAARSEGDLLWETLALTPDFDSAWLELIGQTSATASTPATFIFRVLERFGVNLATSITFSGTAMSANGLAATVGSVTCRVLIADNPQEPAVVSLSLPNQTVDTLSRVSLTVEATAVGEVEWDTLALRAQWDASKLDLVSQAGRTFVFDVKDVHEDLSTIVTVTGTAMSANGLPAIVQPASCTLTLVDTNPPKPAKVSLRTQKTLTAMTEETLAVSVEVVVLEGELDWESLTLTADTEGNGKLTQQGQPTKPTAENPVATFTFDVPEQHGDGLAATLTFSGTATSANGLPVIVQPTTCTLTFIDTNPPKPAKVSLRTKKTLTAMTEETLAVSVEVVVLEGELDWESLTLTADSEGNGKLTQQGQPTKATAENPIVTFTFDVPEQHGDGLAATLTFSGTATSANGLPAIVQPATCTLTLVDTNPPKPAKVSLRTKKTLTAMTEETLAVSVEVVVLEGELDWESLTLTADSEGNGKLTQQGQPTKATAESPVVTFTFDVPEQHGDGLAATLTFSGTAMSANGLPAIVQPASCTLTFIDTNPPVAAKATLRAQKQLTAMTESSFAVAVEVAVTEGELDWDSLELTATLAGEGKLTQAGNPTKPTAENPVATFTFDVPEQHNESGTFLSTITFSGTAMSANGLLPAQLTPTTSVVTLTDANPPVPAKVTLSAEGGSAVTESEVTLAVRVSTVGELDWGTLALTATVEVGGLELRSQTVATAENPTATFTFWVPEQHGDDLFARVTFAGSATSANGLPAQVAPTTVTLALTDSNPPKDPTEVPPWSSGDVDGDGKLTWDDYATARAAIRKYHRPTIRPPRHSSDPNATDNKVHRSICQALGRGENETLSIADITAFQRYLEGLGVVIEEVAQ